MTIAKTGRWMKNFAMATLPFCAGAVSELSGLFGGIHSGARAGLLNALDDDPLAGLDALGDDVVLAHAVAERDAAERHFVVGADDVDDLGALHLA